MAYLGRKGASAPLTSADIPAGSVSAVKVAPDVATQAELDAQRTNSSITTLGTVTAGNLSNSAIVYPVGHVLRVWADEYTFTSPYTFTTTRVDWNGLELSITNPSTSDYLLLKAHLPNIDGNYTTTRKLKVGFVYSTDDFATTGANLGATTYQVWSMEQYEAGEIKRDSVTPMLKVAHPTTSDYKIRLAIIAVGGQTKAGYHASSTQAYIEAMELKG